MVQMIMWIDSRPGICPNLLLAEAERSDILKQAGQNSHRVILAVSLLCLLADSAFLIVTVLLTQREFWTMFECGLTLIAGCLPTFQFLFRAEAQKRISQDIRSGFSNIKSWILGSKQ